MEKMTKNNNTMQCFIFLSILKNDSIGLDLTYFPFEG